MYHSLAVLALAAPAIAADEGTAASAGLVRLLIQQVTPKVAFAADADVQVLLQTDAATVRRRGDVQGEGFALDADTPSLLEPEAKVLHVRQDWVINLVVIIVVTAVVSLTALGFLSGSQGWVTAMFIASYLVLIPGLFSKDFSFNIAVNLDFKALGLPAGTRELLKVLIPDLPTHIQITQPRGAFGPIHESTRSLVGLLWESGCRSGAVLVAVFAFGMPALKLLLLTTGMQLRKSTDATCARLARWAVFSVQVISKWAAPDMFAIILLLHLIHGLDHPPLIESLAVLDVGFTFYAVFCVFSVISTLAMDLHEDSREGGASETSLLWRLLGGRGVLCLCVSLFAAWLVLFVCGILVPCLSIRLHEEKILEQFKVSASVMKMVTPILDKLHLGQLLSDDVSIWACTWRLLSWFASTGRLNLLLACLMLAIFVLAVTALDMLALAATAYQLHVGGGKSRAWAMKGAHVLRHLSFMDVLVVGCLVFSQVASIYEEQGIVVGMRHGIWLLLASEVCHWATFLLLRAVQGA